MILDEHISISKSLKRALVLNASLSPPVPQGNVSFLILLGDEL